MIIREVRDKDEIEPDERSRRRRKSNNINRRENGLTAIYLSHHAHTLRERGDKHTRGGRKGERGDRLKRQL